MSLISTPGLGVRQRQTNLCEFKASLVYRMSSRTGAKATEKPCPKKINKYTHRGTRPSGATCNPSP